MKRTLLPREFISDLILFSKLSKTVKTEIIENIPILMPNKDSKVLTLLTTSAFIANKKLSINNLIKIIVLSFCFLLFLLK